MITININVTKIDKTALYENKNGKHLSLVLFENKKGKDDYGNDGFVAQDLGKERRLAGEKGPILGNFKHVGGFIGGQQDAHNAAKSNGYQPQSGMDKFQDADEGDDIPF